MNASGNGFPIREQLDKSLEEMVRERTAELVKLNGQLQLEIAERKQAERLLETRTHELKTMLAVHQAITSRLKQGTVLQLVADEARRLTNAKRTAVFVVDGEDLRISVISGDDDIKLLGYRMPISGSLTGELIKSGKSIRIDHAAGDPRVYTDIITRAGVRSFTAVPLLTGDHPIGAIVVVDKLEGTFTEDDERSLNMLASAAVIGLENAHLYREEQERRMEAEQRREVAEGLREFLCILNSNRSLQEILDRIIAQAGKLLGTGAVALYRLQPDRKLLHIQAAIGLPEEYSAKMTVPLGRGVVGKAVKEGIPVVLHDIMDVMELYPPEDTERLKYVNQLVAQYKSVVAVPLTGKDETYGGIVLYYPASRSYSEEEMSLAVAFANQAVLAIDNARLRARAEENAATAERSRLARELHDAVTQTLFSATLIAEVLPKILDKNPEEVRRRLTELRQLTRGALAEMRTLLLELRPTTLTELGLKELLQQLAEAVSGRTKIPVRLDMDTPILMPVDVKLAFYRITQEAFNNIAKHSCASDIEVKLTNHSCTACETEAVELLIRDNGRGFDPERITPEHLGLGIMRERADAIGAILKIESKPGKGACIHLHWNNDRRGNANDS